MPNFNPTNQPEKNPPIGNGELPRDIAWEIYARQSTSTNRVQSTAIQIEALVQWLVTRGVQNSQISLFQD